VLLQYPATDGTIADYKGLVAKAHAANVKVRACGLPAHVRCCRRAVLPRGLGPRLGLSVQRGLRLLRSLREGHVTAPTLTAEQAWISISRAPAQCSLAWPSHLPASPTLTPCAALPCLLCDPRCACPLTCWRSPR
jgi:hypothetical protein